MGWPGACSTLPTSMPSMGSAGRRSPRPTRPGGLRRGSDHPAARVVGTSTSCSTPPTSRCRRGRRRTGSMPRSAPGVGRGSPRRGRQADRHGCAEADALLEAADRAGRILSPYQNRRWDGDFQTLSALLEGGALGAIDSLEARFERWGVVGEVAGAGRGGRRSTSRSRRASRGPEPGPVRRRSARVRADGPSPPRQPGRGLDVRGDRSRGWRSLAPVDVAYRRADRSGTPGPGPRWRYVKEDLDPQEVQLLDGLRPNDPGFGARNPNSGGAGSTRATARSGRSRPSAVTTGGSTSCSATRSGAAASGRSIRSTRSVACGSSRRPNARRGPARPRRCRRT